MESLQAQNQIDSLTCSKANLNDTSSHGTRSHEFHAQHPMRVAHVIQRLECGGDAAMVVGIASYFADLGHQVDVLCLDRPTGSAHERHWLSVLNERRVSSQFLGRRTKWPGLVTALKLWWLIQRRHYDVVHSHLSMPDAIMGIIRRFTAVPFKHVLTVHSTNEGRSRIRAMFARGANVVYCSEAAKRTSPMPGTSNIVIPNGILQSSFLRRRTQKAETRLQLGVPNDAIVGIAVGRMCNQKNFDSALDAIAILNRRVPERNLHFLFCGDGQEKERLEARAKHMSLAPCVHFLGNRTDIPVLLAASDVFLSTSLFEGMPVSVLEALTAGLPCVLSSIDEHYEIARTMPGCAFAPPNSPEEIASTLEQVIDNRISPSALDRDRAPLMARFSIATCATSYLLFYNQICHV
jgi:glycosyltransferase involved in cell wall biosynthesis